MPEKQNSPEHYITITETSTWEEDDMQLPPFELKSEFKTPDDWLNYICTHEKPGKQIEKFRFGLFESPDKYILCLDGINTIQKDNNNTVSNVEFQPKKMFFPVPENFYKDLSYDGVVNKLFAALKDFAQTKTFLQSFFTKANTVMFETTGQAIWTKEN